MAQVKGIFFTFGGFFLVMLVVVLSLLVVTTIHQSNARIAESGSLERIYDLDRSIQRVLSQIDDGIQYKIQWSPEFNHTILSVSENLDSDFDEYSTGFYSEVQEFSNFVESDQPEISFDLNKLFNSEEKVPLILKPHNLKYTHLNKDGKNVLTVYPGSQMLEASFKLDMLNETISSIDWRIQNPGSFIFNLTLTDINRNATTSLFSLDPNQINEFIINDHLNLTIGGICPGCFEIDRGYSNLSVNFLTFLPYLSEQATLNYPKGLYEINFSDLGLYLNSTPRIE